MYDVKYSRGRAGKNRPPLDSFGITSGNEIGIMHGALSSDR